MKMIVGLGNPGLTYKNTRHNIGFMFVDSIVKDLKLEYKINKTLKCMYSKTIIHDQEVLFVKPITFMNLSGESVKAVKEYYKIDDDDILIIHDDLDLPVGKIRIRQNGSSGGQKGMNSIISLLQTNAIKRIRIGIDKTDDAIEHVLGKFTKDEREKIDVVMDKANIMLEDYLSVSFENFMNKYNTHE